MLLDSKISKWSNWKRTYTPGLAWGGVGNTYSGNSIYNGPHAGILGGGMYVHARLSQFISEACFRNNKNFLFLILLQRFLIISGSSNY